MGVVLTTEELFGEGGATATLKPNQPEVLTTEELFGEGGATATLEPNQPEILTTEELFGSQSADDIQLDAAVAKEAEHYPDWYKKAQQRESLVRTKLYPSEDIYFKNNPAVTGMAAEDNQVILNPYSNLTDQQKQGVVKNESARIRIRKSGLKPNFALTPEQTSAFRGTAYEKDEQALKETIATRIYSGDPSAGNVTPEQTNWVKKYLREPAGETITTEELMRGKPKEKPTTEDPVVKVLRQPGQVKWAIDLLEQKYPDLLGNLLDNKTGKPITEWDYKKLRATIEANQDVFGKEAFKDLQRVERSVYPWVDVKDRMKWFVTSMAAKTPGLARITLGKEGARNLRQELHDEAKEFTGVSSQFAEPAADAAWFYLKYLKMYPAILGRAREYVSGIKELPRVKKVVDSVERAGGIDWLYEKFPRTVFATESALETFGTTLTVVTPLESVQAWGEGKPFEESWPQVRNNALTYAGVTTAFDVASSIDRAKYIKDLRAGLMGRSVANYKANYDSLMLQLKKVQRATPIGTQRGRQEQQIGSALKSLNSLYETEIKTIDKAVASLEAEMTETSRSHTYKENELVRESALQKVEMLAEKGPLSEQFTKMPIVRAKPYEIIREGQTRPPIRIERAISEAKQAIEGKTENYPTFGDVRPILKEIKAMKAKEYRRLEQERATKEIKTTEELAAMDAELAEIQRNTIEQGKKPSGLPQVEKQGVIAPEKGVTPIAEATVKPGEVLGVKPAPPSGVPSGTAPEAKPVEKPADFTLNEEVANKIRNMALVAEHETSESGYYFLPSGHRIRISDHPSYGYRGQASDIYFEPVLDDYTSIVGRWIVRGGDESVEVKTPEQAVVAIQTFANKNKPLGYSGYINKITLQRILRGEPVSKKDLPVDVQVLKLDKFFGGTPEKKSASTTDISSTKKLSSEEPPSRVVRPAEAGENLPGEDAGGIVTNPAVGLPQQGIEPPTVPRMPEAKAESETTTPPAGSQEQIKRNIEEMSEAEFTGIGKQRRSSLKKEAVENIVGHDIYQEELRAQGEKRQLLGVGYYYVPAKLRSEVEDVIGRVRKNIPTKLQRMFTFDPTELNKGALHWEKAVQTGFETREGGREAGANPEMDISEFVNWVKNSVESKAQKGGLNSWALKKAKESGDPFLEYWHDRLRLIEGGASDKEIDNYTREWASQYGIIDEELTKLWVGTEELKLEDIRRTKDPAEKERLFTKLAEENIDRQMRQQAKEAVDEVLKANDIKDVETRQVDLIGRPVLEGGATGEQGEFLSREDYRLAEPDIEGQQVIDDIPFETKGGKRTGAAITTGEQQVVLLAYGADSATGYHEGYHILRGRLTERDTGILDRHFKGDQEAEARAFAGFVKEQKAPRPILKHIWQKITAILGRIKSAMRGKGYRRPADIFGEALMGRIAKETRLAGTAIRYEADDRPDIVKQSIREAAIKGEKARLKEEIFRREHGRRLRSRIKIKLQDVTPALREDLAPEITQPQKREKLLSARDALAESQAGWKKETGGVVPEEVYKLNRQKKTLTEKATKIGGTIGEHFKAVIKGIDKAVFSSTRTYKISPDVFRMTRRWAYDYGIRTAGMEEDMAPFLKATHKMSKDDWKDLDLALKNRDTEVINRYINKYNLTGEYSEVRNTDNDIFDAGNAVGFDMGYLKDHWHRRIKDVKGYLRYVEGSDDWSIVKKELKARAEKMGRTVEELTPEERAGIIDSLYRGYPGGAITLSRPGAAKERTVLMVDDKLNEFYDDSRAAMIFYIRDMNAKIAMREFFGKETKQVTDLRRAQTARRTRLLKLQRIRGMRAGEETQYDEHISKTWQDYLSEGERLTRLQHQPLTASIGGLVDQLVQSGKMKASQEIELRGILQGLFEPKSMDKTMSVVSAGIYLDVMNSPVQMITQLEELYSAFYRSPRDFPKGLWDALRGKSKLPIRNIGLSSMGEEFTQNIIRQATSTQLKVLGITPADMLGKQTNDNTILAKYEREAKRPHLKADFINRIKRTFGGDYRGVIEDLRVGKTSEDVKFLIWNEIADMQPIAKTEVPESYQKAGNWRIVWTLKQYSCKRLDFWRKEAFSKMAHKDTFVEGSKNLLWLAVALGLFGATRRALQDFIRGKVIKLTDNIVNTYLDLFTLSKYEVRRAWSEGWGKAILDGTLPPSKFADELGQDVYNFAKGRDRGFELWKSIPGVGDLYYNWYGEGAKKHERQREKEQATERPLRARRTGRPARGGRTGR